MLAIFQKSKHHWRQSCHVNKFCQGQTRKITKDSKIFRHHEYNWRAALKPLVYHSIVVLRCLKGPYNWAPIMPWSVSLSGSQCDICSSLRACTYTRKPICAFKQYQRIVKFSPDTKRVHKYNRAFRLLVRSSFVLAYNNC